MIFDIQIFEIFWKCTVSERSACIRHNLLWGYEQGQDNLELLTNFCSFPLNIPIPYIQTKEKNTTNRIKLQEISISEIFAFYSLNGRREIRINSKERKTPKKQLYNTILQQLEFYFSDSNLTKDRFLSQLIREDPYVELSQFLKFNKLRKLTESIDDLRKVIKKSDILELSEDNEKVRRKTPMIAKENVDECTIYVERISADANHEFLATIFSDFGKVVYVSIPKYRHNQMNKGFAFVEFETEQDAQNAVRYFENIGCKMSSNINPQLLCSISSYNIESQIDINITEENEKESSGIEEKETDVGDNQQVYSNEKSDLIIKSVKRRCDDELTGLNKKLKESKEDDHSDEIPPQNDTSECKKKKKKELKKKNLIKELGIQVLSKQEWKKMRNGYLNLQRKKMKEIKLHLSQSKFSKHNSIGRNHQNVENRPIKEHLEEKPTKLEYIPGTIVKMTLQEPLQSDKKIKI
ncbi:hypothetical protein WA026_023675 [Henosepilachna vigintioctopunctata]|uniref:La-related protein 7 n=1 Tax=Henosepilachna vigintioctopunctata TaxID=420089 RepID=A0AAW1UHC7_9CUCU